MKNRKSIRLSGYDYSQDGWYFVTVCSYDRGYIFGKIQNEKMVLNDVGKIVLNSLNKLSKRFDINIDCFVIMPNHVHMVINSVGVSFMKPEFMKFNLNPKRFEIAKSYRHMGLMNQTPTLGHIIRYFKGKISYELHTNGFNMKIWQRNYYEHIIRNERELEKIREYIDLNPARWKKDKDNPDNIKI
ncbi:MAG: transposase [Patescibacteria group bacterium]|nr:hypothetical protein [Patescibacteria group bacterium]